MGQRAKTGLLEDFALCGVPRRLVFFDVTPRLQPQMELFVKMKKHPLRSHHDGRSRYVRRIGMLRKWARLCQSGEDLLLRRAFARIDRQDGIHLGVDSWRKGSPANARHEVKRQG